MTKLKKRKCPYCGGHDINFAKLKNEYVCMDCQHYIKKFDDEFNIMEVLR